MFFLALFILMADALLISDHGISIRQLKASNFQPQIEYPLMCIEETFRGSCNQNLLNAEEEGDIKVFHDQLFNDFLNGKPSNNNAKRKETLRERLNAPKDSNKAKLITDSLKSYDLLALKKYMDDLTFSLSLNLKNKGKITEEELKLFEKLEAYMPYKEYLAAIMALQLNKKPEELPKEFLDGLSELNGAEEYARAVLSTVMGNQKHLQTLESKGFEITSKGIEFPKRSSNQKNTTVIPSDFFTNEPEVIDALSSLFASNIKEELSSKRNLVDKPFPESIIIKNKVILPKYRQINYDLQSSPMLILDSSQKIIMDKNEYDKKIVKELSDIETLRTQYYEKSVEYDGYLSAANTLMNGPKQHLEDQRKTLQAMWKVYGNLVNLGYPNDVCRAINKGLKELSELDKEMQENNRMKGMHLKAGAVVAAIGTAIALPIVATGGLAAGSFSLGAGVKAVGTTLAVTATADIAINTFDSYFNSTNRDLFCAIVEGMQKGSRKFVQNFSVTNILVPLALGGFGELSRYLVYQSVDIVTSRRAEIFAPFFGISPEEYLKNESKFGTVENNLAILSSFAKFAASVYLLGGKSFFSAKAVDPKLAGFTKFVRQWSHVISPIGMGITGSLGQMWQAMGEGEEFSWQKLITDTHVGISSSLVFMGALNSNAMARVSSGKWTAAFAEKFSSAVDFMEASFGLIDVSTKFWDEAYKDLSTLIIHKDLSTLTIHNGFKLAGLFLSLGTEIYDSMDGMTSGWINIREGLNSNISKMKAGGSKLISFAEKVSRKSNLTLDEAASIYLKERLTVDFVDGTSLTGIDSVNAALILHKELTQDNTILENSNRKDKAALKEINNLLLAKLDAFLDGFNYQKSITPSAISKIVQTELSKLVSIQGDKETPSTQRKTSSDSNQNSPMSDASRLKEAEKVLDLKENSLSDIQKNAILRAHSIGRGEIGKDGKTVARIGNYTEAQNIRKGRMLREAFTEIETRKLMETGITGDEFSANIDSNIENLKVDILLEFIARNKSNVANGGRSRQQSMDILNEIIDVFNEKAGFLLREEDVKEMIAEVVNEQSNVSKGYLNKDYKDEIHDIISDLTSDLNLMKKLNYSTDLMIKESNNLLRNKIKKIPLKSNNIIDILLFFDTSNSKEASGEGLVSIQYQLVDDIALNSYESGYSDDYNNEIMHSFLHYALRSQRFYVDESIIDKIIQDIQPEIDKEIVKSIQEEIRGVENIAVKSINGAILEFDKKVAELIQGAKPKIDEEVAGLIQKAILEIDEKVEELIQGARSEFDKEVAGLIQEAEYEIGRKIVKLIQDAKPETDKPDADKKVVKLIQDAISEFDKKVAELKHEADEEIAGLNKLKNSKIDEYETDEDEIDEYETDEDETDESIYLKSFSNEELLKLIRAKTDNEKAFSKYPTSLSKKEWQELAKQEYSSRIWNREKEKQENEEKKSDYARRKEKLAFGSILENIIDDNYESNIANGYSIGDNFIQEEAVEASEIKNEETEDEKNRSQFYKDLAVTISDELLNYDNYVQRKMSNNRVRFIISAIDDGTIELRKVDEELIIRAVEARYQSEKPEITHAEFVDLKYLLAEIESLSIEKFKLSYSNEGMKRRSDRYVESRIRAIEDVLRVRHSYELVDEMQKYYERMYKGEISIESQESELRAIEQKIIRKSTYPSMIDAYSETISDPKMEERINREIRNSRDSENSYTATESALITIMEQREEIGTPEKAIRLFNFINSLPVAKLNYSKENEVFFNKVFNDRVSLIEKILGVDLTDEVKNQLKEDCQKGRSFIDNENIKLFINSIKDNIDWNSVINQDLFNPDIISDDRLALASIYLFAESVLNIKIPYSLKKYIRSGIFTKKIAQAEILLKRELKDFEKESIWQAHLVGMQESGKNGGIASINNYTPNQIKEKTRILEKAGFQTKERTLLFENGIVGQTIESKTREILKELKVKEELVNKFFKDKNPSFGNILTEIINNDSKNLNFDISKFKNAPLEARLMYISKIFNLEMSLKVMDYQDYKDNTEMNSLIRDVNDVKDPKFGAEEIVLMYPNSKDSKNPIKYIPLWSKSLEYKVSNGVELFIFLKENLDEKVFVSLVSDFFPELNDFSNPLIPISTVEIAALTYSILRLNDKDLSGLNSNRIGPVPVNLQNLSPLYKKIFKDLTSKIEASVINHNIDDIIFAGEIIHFLEKYIEPTDEMTYEKLIERGVDKNILTFYQTLITKTLGNQKFAAFNTNNTFWIFNHNVIRDSLLIHLENDSKQRKAKSSSGQGVSGGLTEDLYRAINAFMYLNERNTDGTRTNRSNNLFVESPPSLYGSIYDPRGNNNIIKPLEDRGTFISNIEIELEIIPKPNTQPIKVDANLQLVEIRGSQNSDSKTSVPGTSRWYVLSVDGELGDKNTLDSFLSNPLSALQYRSMQQAYVDYYMNYNNDHTDFVNCLKNHGFNDFTNNKKLEDHFRDKFNIKKYLSSSSIVNTISKEDLETLLAITLTDAEYKSIELAHNDYISKRRPVFADYLKIHDLSKFDSDQNKKLEKYFKDSLKNKTPLGSKQDLDILLDITLSNAEYESIELAHNNYKKRRLVFADYLKIHNFPKLNPDQNKKLEKHFKDSLKNETPLGSKQDLDILLDLTLSDSKYKSIELTHNDYISKRPLVFADYLKIHDLSKFNSDQNKKLEAHLEDSLKNETPLGSKQDLDILLDLTLTDSEYKSIKLVHKDYIRKRPPVFADYLKNYNLSKFNSDQNKKLEKHFKDSLKNKTLLGSKQDLDILLDLTLSDSEYKSIKLAHDDYISKRPLVFADYLKIHDLSKFNSDQNKKLETHLKYSLKNKTPLGSKQDLDILLDLTLTDSEYKSIELVFHGYSVDNPTFDDYIKLHDLSNFSSNSALEKYFIESMPIKPTVIVGGHEVKRFNNRKEGHANMDIINNAKKFIIEIIPVLFPGITVVK